MNYNWFDKDEILKITPELWRHGRVRQVLKCNNDNNT